MALHSRDVVTVSAAVATRSRADCSSMEGLTSLSTAQVTLAPGEECEGTTFGSVCLSVCPDA